jgi:hypothetical protein
MKFAIDSMQKAINKKILFTSLDGIVATLPQTHVADLCIPFVTIGLFAVGRSIIGLEGFINSSSWIISPLTPPVAIQGALTYKGEPDKDSMFDMAERALEVRYDPDSHWACIGNPAEGGTAVEFIYDVIAVLDKNQELSALWLNLKPYSRTH